MIFQVFLSFSKNSYSNIENSKLAYGTQADKHTSAVYTSGTSIQLVLLLPYPLVILSLALGPLGQAQIPQRTLYPPLCWGQGWVGLGSDPVVRSSGIVGDSVGELIRKRWCQNRVCHRVLVHFPFVLRCTFTVSMQEGMSS